MGNLRSLDDGNVRIELDCKMARFLASCFFFSYSHLFLGLLTTLAIGLTLLVAAVLISRTALADYIYQPVRPRTWCNIPALIVVSD
jgi:hypothetical protein